MSYRYVYVPAQDDWRLMLAAEILTTETAAIRTNFAAESVSQI